MQSTFVHRNDLCAVGFLDDHYPVQSSFSLLNQVLDEYQKNFGDSRRAMKVENTQLWPYLNEALAKFQDPAEADKLFRIQRELDETKNNLMFYKQVKKTSQCCTIL